MDQRHRPDPLLDELEADRLGFEARFGGDMKKISAYYMEYQRRFADRLVTREQLDGERSPRPAEVGKSAA